MSFLAFQTGRSLIWWVLVLALYCILLSCKHGVEGVNLGNNIVMLDSAPASCTVKNDGTDRKSVV